MRQHPLIGSMMIMQHLPESLEVKDAVAAHHERWDGKGYPAQLLGTADPAARPDHGGGRLLSRP